jgi:hypothetical protein
MATCVEVYGPSSASISIPTPPASVPLSAPFGCVGWGPAPSPLTEFDQVPDGAVNPWFASVSPSTYADVVMFDSSQYQFKIRPKRPTDSVHPTIAVKCNIDPTTTNAVRTVNIHITGTPAVLASMSAASNGTTLLISQSKQITVTYVDNYGGINLLSPTPATTYHDNPHPAGSFTVSNTGLVTATAIGVDTVTADSGTKHSNAIVFTSIACSSVAVTPNSPITFHNSTGITLTATPSCSPGINATTEPIVWSTGSTSVATVAMTGSAHHTGIVSPVAPGTTTVEACDQTVTGPPCSATISITVPTPSVDISGPAAISVKGTYTYVLSRIDFLTNPSVAWTERFCTGSVTCAAPWTSLAASGDTARRTLTPNCTGTGENYYEVSVLASAGGAETATAQHNTRLCPVPP